MLHGEIIKKIYNLLHEHYGSQKNMFDYAPFRMMLTAFLKDSASWDGLVKTLDVLDAYKSPDVLLGMSPEIVAKKLSLCNAPGRTARDLAAFLKKLRTWGYTPEDYAGYDADSLKKFLLKEFSSNKSVVDFMLLYVFNLPICAVNPDVGKLLSRIDPDSGWEKLGHEELSQAIMDSSGDDLETLKELSMLFLLVTREHCFPSHPACRTCPLLYMCSSAGEF